MNANDGQPGEKAQYTYNVGTSFEGCLRFHYSMIGLDVASLQVCILLVILLILLIFQDLYFKLLGLHFDINLMSI